MSPLFLVLALLQSQEKTPFQLAGERLKVAPGYSARLKVSFKSGVSFSGTYSYRKPFYQRLRLSNDKRDSEFLQNSTCTCVLFHSDKDYVLYPPFDRAEPPPSEAYAELSMGRPALVCDGALSKIAPGAAWKATGSDTVQGVHVTVYALFDRSGSQADEPAKLWIDDLGGIRRSWIRVDTADGSVEVTTELTDVSYADPGIARFSLRLPRGFVPAKQPRTHTVVGTGNAVKLGPCLRWPLGEPADLSQAGTMAPVLVALTSCELEDDTNDWTRLAEAAKAAHVRFIQVWVGPEPPRRRTAWESFWDKDGAIDHALSPPTTPLLFGIKGGEIVSGWSGWRPTDLDEATQALLGPMTAGAHSAKTRSAKIKATKSSTGSGGL